MFTVDIKDLNQVINSKDIVKEADTLTEEKALQCTKYGCFSVAIAVVVSLVIAAIIGVSITDTLIGWAILPLAAALALRVWYIKTLYYDNLVLAALKHNNS